MPRPRKDSFNPRSPDAMFATILRRLDEQDEQRTDQHEENKTTLNDIRNEVRLTNGRVTKLENWRAYQKGKTVILAVLVSLGVSIIACCSAWLLWHFRP